MSRRLIQKLAAMASLMALSCSHITPQPLKLIEINYLSIDGADGINRASEGVQQPAPAKASDVDSDGSKTDEENKGVKAEE